MDRYTPAPLPPLPTNSLPPVTLGLPPFPGPRGGGGVGPVIPTFPPPSTLPSPSITSSPMTPLTPQTPSSITPSSSMYMYSVASLLRTPLGPHYLSLIHVQCSLFIKDTIGPTLPVLNTCTV